MKLFNDIKYAFSCFLQSILSIESNQVVKTVLYLIPIVAICLFLNVNIFIIIFLIIICSIIVWTSLNWKSIKKWIKLNKKKAIVGGVAISSILGGAGFLLFDTPPPAADTGWVAASSEGDTYSDWDNPTYAYGDETSKESAAVGRENTQPDQDYYGFSFGLSGSNTFQGIEIQMDGRKIPNNVDINIKLSWDGGSTWTSTKSFIETNDSFTKSYLGGATDTWGRSWTTSEFSTANFIVAFLLQGGTGDYYQLDYVAAKVYYTATPSNANPVNSDESPTNGATGENLNPDLGITVNDTDVDTMNQTFRTNASGTWVSIAWNNGTTNASLSNSTTVFSSYSTKYWWSSNLTDNHSAWDNDTYYFTTKANTAPDPDSPSPANGSTEVQISGGVECSIDADDANGDTVDATWATNESSSWVIKHTDSSVAANSTQQYTFTDFDTANTKYWWKVYVDDSFDNISEIYHFTTAEVFDILLIYNTSTASKVVDFKDWKEGNSSYSVTSINISTITLNSTYWATGYYGDNNTNNPFYVSQTIADESIYNTTEHHVRNYIRYMFNNHSVGYVIFFGDDSKFQTYDWVTDIISGMYTNDVGFYGCLYSTQNYNDNQSYYGAFDGGTEGIYDTTPEVNISRMAYWDDDQWSNIFEKTKNFSALPYSDTQFNNIVVGASNISHPHSYWDAKWDTRYRYTCLYGWAKSSLVSFLTGDGFDYMINQSHSENLTDYLNLEKTGYANGFGMYIQEGHQNSQYYGLNDYASVSANLTNGTHPYIQIFHACLSGNFSMPGLDTFNGLRSPGGSVIGWGPDSLTYSGKSNYYYLNEIFRNNATIGDAICNAYTEIFGSALRTCNILGDGTLRYKYPQYPSVFEVRPWDAQGGLDTGNAGVTTMDCSVADYDGDSMTVYWRSNVSGGWATINTDNSVDTGDDLEWSSTDFLTANTKYWFSINCTDGTHWNNATYYFTTNAEASTGIDWIDNLEDQSTLSPRPQVYITQQGASRPSVFFNYHNTSDSSWTLIQTNTTDLFPILTNTTCITQYNHTYTITVNATHGTEWDNRTMYIHCRNAYVTSGLDTYNLTPTSDPGDEYFNASTGTDNYAMVDDAFDSPDANTTYVFVNGSNKAQEYTQTYGTSIENILSEYDDCLFDFITLKVSFYFAGIHDTPVGFYLYRSVEDPKTMKIEEETLGVAEHWKNYTYNMSIDPWTGTNWTHTNLNATELIVMLENGDGWDPRCSQFVIRGYVSGYAHNTTVRTNGVDYFVWLGRNQSAWHIKDELGATFDESSETISILNNTGNWDNYTGASGGNNFSIHTFDVVKIVLGDGAGTLTFNMVTNPNIDYTIARTVTLTKVGNGYNFTGWTNSTATTLSAENTSLSLSTGYFLALWNETNYAWDYWISGWWETDKDILQYDVIMTKVSTTKSNWQVG